MWLSGAPFGHHVFNLIGAFAKFHAPFATHLVTSKGIRVLERAAQYLTRAVEFISTEQSKEEWMRRLRFDLPVKEIIQLFCSMTECDRAQTFYRFVAFGERLAPVLQAVKNILAKMGHGQHDLLEFLNFYLAVSKADIDRKTGGVALIRMDREDFTLSSPDRLGDLFSTMITIRQEGCKNISCANDTQVIHARLCSGCDVVRYCGPEVGSLCTCVRMNTHSGCPM
jgi:hypothetical protein